MLQLPVYLDYNATTPCDPRVVDAMLPYFTNQFGNAASVNHSYGWQAEEAVKIAREQVAALINADPTEIVFTSGATEADNLALKGVAEMYASAGNHIISVSTEHKAVLDTLAHLEKKGLEVTLIDVDKNGLIDASDIEVAIRPNTILIAMMYANNETGVIMPVKAVSAIARKHNTLFFSDAAQAVGKIPVDVQTDGIDIMAMSAHKLYGPKGIGALYVRRKSPRVRLTAQMDGGGHERGFRSGTLNVPAIVGFGKACAIAADEMKTDAARLAVLRDKLEQSMLKLDGITVNGSAEHRLPHVTNLAFAGVDSNGLMRALVKELAVSSGSACTSASIEPSYVLKAMGIDDELAHSSIRMALGRFTTEEEINFAVERLIRATDELRSLRNAES